MAKRILIFVMLTMILTVTGCATPTAKPIVLVPTAAAGTATPTPEPVVIVITATPETPVPGGPEFATPTPGGAVMEPTLAATSSMGATIAAPSQQGQGITITSVDAIGNGRAEIHWTANGSFPAGFRVVYSSTSQTPTYPNDQNYYYGDPNTRGAIISGKVNTIYYARVCRVVNDSCDMYSNLGIFAIFPNTPTPTIKAPTKIPGSSGSGSIPGGSGNGTNTSYNAAGTPISASSVIVIVKMEDAVPGKAYIEWKASADAPDGFRIAYSKTDALPTVDKDSYYAIPDGKMRYAYVDGVPGSSYYFRLCQVSGKTCDIYSAPYKFTFAGTAPTSTKTIIPSPTVDGSTITIGSFTNTTTGSGTIGWSVSGTFPSGFKVMYSYINNPPTTSDNIAVAISTDRSATVYGLPGVKYYFRVCKLVSGSCTIYSGVANGTFTPEISLSVADNAGKAELTWTNSGSAPATGYAILRVIGTSDPINTAWHATVDNATLLYDDTVTSGITYTYRVCGYDTGDFTSCSLPFTYMAP